MLGFTWCNGPPGLGSVPGANETAACRNQEMTAAAGHVVHQRFFGSQTQKKSPNMPGSFLVVIRYTIYTYIYLIYTLVFMMFQGTSMIIPHDHHRPLFPTRWGPYDCYRWEL